MFTFAMLMLVTADNLVQLFFAGKASASRLSADRLLVPQARGQRAAIKPSSSSHRRLRLRARHLCGVHDDRAVDFGTIFHQAPALVGKTIHFFKWDVDASP